MRSKARHEGYFLLDHRACVNPDGPRFLESATYTCSHCQVVVVINMLRQRERAYCPKCDHYICDACGKRREATGGECKTFNQIIEETQEHFFLMEQANGKT